MSLFDQVVSALNNPNQQASQSQLGGILGTVQQLANSQNIPPSTTQTLLSVLGNHVRSSLQNRRTASGNSQVEDLVNRYSGTRANPQAVRSVFTPQEEQETVQDTARATGLNVNTIQALLPILIPVVLNLLQTGASTQNSQSSRSNSVLNTFLDSDQSGSVDVGDVISLASRFMQSR